MDFNEDIRSSMISAAEGDRFSSYHQGLVTCISGVEYFCSMLLIFKKNIHFFKKRNAKSLYSSWLWGVGVT